MTGKRTKKKKPVETVVDVKIELPEPPKIGVRTDIGPAYRVGPETPANVLLPAQPAFGFKLGTLSEYTVLPERLKDDPTAQAIGWRIEIHGLVNVQALGFDIMGDVIMGRLDTDPEENLIDLEPYKAISLGVSRKHAMLRPTKRALFLLDLKSANGTFHNSLRLNSSFVRALSDGDTISLGNLTFQLRIIDRPKRTPRG